MQVELKWRSSLILTIQKGSFWEIYVSSVCISRYIVCYFTEKTVSLAKILDLKLISIWNWLEIPNFRQIFEESFY